MTLFLGILLLLLAWYTALCMDTYVAHREMLKSQSRLRATRIESLILSKLYLLPPSEFRLRWAERNLKRLNELV